MDSKYGDLQIEEDMSFQQWTWKVERAAWVLMALVVLAAALGLISEGPLSKTRKGDPAKLQIECERFPHVDAPTRIEIRLAVDGPFALQFPYEYLSKMEISNVVPEPDRVASSGGMFTYSFSAERGIAHVLFDLEFRKFGVRRGFVQSDDRRVDFTQYVYP